MKKQIVAALSALALAVTLTACGDKAKEDRSREEGCRKGRASDQGSRGKGGARRRRPAAKDAADAPSKAAKDAAAATSKAADATKEAADKAVRRQRTPRRSNRPPLGKAVRRLPRSSSNG